jgi:hypothetical protein
VSEAGKTSFSYFSQLNVARLSWAARLMQGARQIVRTIPVRHFIDGTREAGRNVGVNAI